MNEVVDSKTDVTLRQIPSMLDKDNTIYDFKNIPILFSKVPEKELSSLSKRIEDIQSKWNAEPFNKKLAGHLEKEFLLNDIVPDVEEYILYLTSMYNKTFDIVSEMMSKNHRFMLQKLWVNFQKKHEFNPPHFHSGVISFVIWHKIPYDLKEEEKLYNAVKNQTSRFGFLTCNHIGKIYATTLPIDKSFEGVLCMFPSSMMHYVNPFYTSDEYRISVSGNVCLDSNMIVE